MVPEWLTNLISLLPGVNIGDETNLEGDRVVQISLEDLENVQEVNIGHLPGDRYFDIEEADSGHILTADPASLDDEKWEEMKEYLGDGWIENDNVTTSSAHTFFKLVRENYEREEIHEIMVYFDGKVRHRHHRMLEKCLNVGFYAMSGNASRDEVRRRKRQIANTHGSEAWNMANLASAGYFDEGRLFRDCYNDYVIGGDWSEEKYEEEFAKLIENIPFVVFVEGENTASEILDIVIGKAIRTKDFDIDIDFIDVRGVGPENHKTIDDFAELLMEYYDEAKFERESSGRVMAIRINVDSLQR